MSAAGDSSVSGLSPISKGAAAASDPSVEKNNAANASAAAAGGGGGGRAEPQRKSNVTTSADAATLEDPANSFAPFLEEKAQRFLKEEKYRDALNAREHVLRCYLRAFGEQSNEANLQKQLLSALILKAGDYEKHEKEQQQQQRKGDMNTSSASAASSSASASASPNRSSSSGGASGGGRDPYNDRKPRNLVHSMFGSPVGDLTMSSRLEYAQMLLSPQSIGPVLSEDPNLRHLRARLMLAHSTITAKMHRARSAIPMLTEAMRILQGLVAPSPDPNEYGEEDEEDDEEAEEKRQQRRNMPQLSPSNQEAARLELCESYLTKSVLLSNTGKHEEALATVMWGLAAILQLEEESWRNFQDLRGADPNAPRAKIFHASLQAACHHNIGAEQEHLALTELALDSYETGFELAISCFGVNHPMSERLKMCYSDLFAQLHYKHFVRNGEQRDVAKQALKDSEIAITHLRASYYASERHRAALQDQTKKQTKMLSKAGTDTSLEPAGSLSTGRSGRPSSSKSRPGSSKTKKSSSSSTSRRRAGSKTPSSTASRPNTANRL